ncbi:MAG: DUF6089 family protein [Bacteroidia bacterium]
MKKLCFLFLVIFSFSQSFSQGSELGLFLGVATYGGELKHQLFTTDYIHPAIGLQFRKNFSKHWSANLNATYGKISAADSTSEDPFQLERNLSFKSNILEVGGRLEFNFFPYYIGNEDWPFTPFLFIGIAGYRFNPMAEIGDDEFELQPLGTEGQGTTSYPDRKKYKRTQISVPYGGGFKFTLTRRVGVNIEAGVRKTYTDYLDDVSTTYADKATLSENGTLAIILSDRSPGAALDDFTGKQRGNSRDTDKYLFAGVTLSFRLGNLTREKCHFDLPK